MSWIFTFIYLYLGAWVNYRTSWFTWLTGGPVHTFIAWPDNVDFGLRKTVRWVDYDYHMIHYMEPQASKSGTRPWRYVRSLPFLGGGALAFGPTSVSICIHKPCLYPLIFSTVSHLSTKINHRIGSHSLAGLWTLLHRWPYIQLSIFCPLSLFGPENRSMVDLQRIHDNHDIRSQMWDSYDEW